MNIEIKMDHGGFHIHNGADCSILVACNETLKEGMIYVTWPDDCLMIWNLMRAGF